MSVVTTNQAVTVEAPPGKRVMRIRNDPQIGRSFPADRQLVEGRQITKHLSAGQPTLFRMVPTQST